MKKIFYVAMFLLIPLLLKTNVNAETLFVSGEIQTGKRVSSDGSIGTHSSENIMWYHLSQGITYTVNPNGTSAYRGVVFSSSKGASGTYTSIYDLNGNTTSPFSFTSNSDGWLGYCYSAADTYNVTVSYVVTPQVTLTSLNINVVSNTVSNGFNLTDSYFTIVANYSDGTSETLTSGYTLTYNIDTSVSGVYPVTVVYNDVSASINITVSEPVAPPVEDPVPVSITVIAQSTMFAVDSVISDDNYSVYLNYSDNTQELLTMGYEIDSSDVDTSQVGTYSVIVTYYDFTYTVAITIYSDAPIDTDLSGVCERLDNIYNVCTLMLVFSVFNVVVGVLKRQGKFFAREEDFK